MRPSWHEHFGESPDVLKSARCDQTIVPVLEKAWSDADQTLSFAEFDEMMASLDPYVALRQHSSNCEEVPVDAVEAVG